VLRWFARAGRHERADALDVARLRRRWRLLAGCLGFGIEGQDRAGLERLLRYCARPPFALERLEQLAHDQLVYRFPRTRTGERRWRKYWRQVEHTPGCATGCKLPIGISRIVVQLLRQESDRADRLRLWQDRSGSRTARSRDRADGERVFESAGEQLAGEEAGTIVERLEARHRVRSPATTMPASSSRARRQARGERGFFNSLNATAKRAPAREARRVRWVAGDSYPSPAP